MADDDREELAEDRTDLAEDRTVLANERTFAGWMRTGYSAVALALGFHALFNRMEPGWVPRSISTAFLVTAIFIFWASARRAAAVCRRLDSHSIKELRGWQLTALAVVMVLVTTAMIAATWMLRIEPE